MTSLSRNTVICSEDKEKPNYFRILKIDSIEVYYIDMAGKSGMPISLDIEEAFKLLVSKKWQIVSEDDCYRILGISDPVNICQARLDLDNDDNIRCVKEMNSAWQSIASIVGDQNKCWNKKERARLIRNSVEMNQCSEKVIYLRLRRYWIYGQTKLALYPLHVKKGSLIAERKLNGAKLGRPRVADNANKQGVNIVGEVKEKLLKGIRRFYVKNNCGYESAYQFTLEIYFRNTNLEGEFDPLSSQDLPTKTQFIYWAKKVMSEDMRGNGRKKYGARRYDANFRPKIFDTLTNFSSPGECFIGDGFHIPVHLKNSINNSEIKAFPKIYAFIDHMSHRWMGFFITLDSLNYQAALVAFYNACSSKKSLLLRYGIDGNAWEGEVVPNIVHIDNGEFRTGRKERITDSLGVGFMQDPPYRPDLKGLIEGAIALIKRDLSVLPGHNDKDSRLRRHEDSVDPVLSINDLTKIIIRVMLYQNRYKTVNSKLLPLSVIQSGIKLFPDAIWDWGMKNCPPSLIKVDRNRLALALLERDKAKITSAGLYFKGRYYRSEYGDTHQWWLAARDIDQLPKKSSRHRYVNICYDPWFIDRILVEVETGKFEMSTLTQNYEKFSIFSSVDFDEYQNSEKSKRLSVEVERRQGLSSLHDDMRKIEAESRLRNRKVGDMVALDDKKFTEVKKYVDEPISSNEMYRDNLKTEKIDEKDFDDHLQSYLE